jgi:FkbM family methyltransferase
VARWLRWRLPRRIAGHRILSGPLRGRRIVTSWRDYPAAIAGITEPQLLAWFARNVRAGETWLDVGAHYGYTAIALADLVGPAGRVFAFEPMVATAGCVSRTRFLNDFASLTVVPMALGSVDGITIETLPTIRGMVDSTITSSGGENVPAQTWNEPILVTQLDWLWPRLAGGNETIHGVKIDVQGMELHVLKGMVKTLLAQRPKLVVELHHGVDREAICSTLESLGYSRQATPIEPVEGEVEARFLDDRSYAFSVR